MSKKTKIMLKKRIFKIKKKTENENNKTIIINSINHKNEMKKKKRTNYI